MDRRRSTAASDTTVDTSLVPSESAVPDCLQHSPLRVAVICDLLEEKWPSMDLVGDMLCRYLAEHQDVRVTQLRPPLRQRLARLPVLPARLTWNADRLINRFSDYPDWLRSHSGDFDVFHVVDHSYAQLIRVLPSARTVVTCHDLDTFRCLLEPEREPRPRWFRAMARRILEGFRQAAHVIAVSAATRDDLLHHRLVDAERITVIPNGVHPAFSAIPNPEADRAAARMLPSEPSDAAVILSVGNTMSRKRLDVLIRIFAQVHRKNPDTRLIRVGGLTGEHLRLLKELNIERAVVNLPFLDRDVLAALYRRATILLHTAEAEGFGLPLIEAMASGCPVLASDLPVLREVGGTASRYFAVGDVSAGEGALVQLLRERHERPAAWELRRQEGLAWAARFSWNENARAATQVYEKVMANSSSAGRN